MLHDQERRLLDQGSHVFGWVRDTTAGTFWSRLNGVDFMNSSLQFAALTVLCLFPFLIIVSAESGGDARHALVARLGLDQNAAQDINELMSSGRHAVTTLSIVGPRSCSSGRWAWPPPCRSGTSASMTSHRHGR